MPLRWSVIGGLLPGRYLTGATNYWVDVYSANGEEVAARVWLLDSNDRNCDQLKAGW